MDEIGPRDVVSFWRDAGPGRWFTKDASFDQEVRGRFMAAWEAARAGERDGWAETPEGALALVILLDQMPRNMFRGDPRTWSTDEAARHAAERAIAAGHDSAVDPALRSFFFLPLMHAEDLAAQERSVALYEQHGDPDNLTWARHHRDVIARFGRFPHRNAVLGRTSTPEELAFLAEDDFRG
ncbi:DUF924 family protein [Enterovirga sp.]|uniref:DUF924 family protein n=1 Tax=Enterovirga sp. TaxID=2026350 RepID=UPI002623A61C|nr:DUF924 family protein [Enterovirga sp.]MDB5590121.1 hypothetical protein [Enterovirga sp.]